MTRRSCRWLIGVVVAALVWRGGLRAQEPTADAVSIGQRLRIPVLQPAQPWNEFRTFVDAHVPLFDPPRTLSEWKQQQESWRKKILDGIVFRGEAARWRDAPSRVKWFETIESAAGYRIRKFAYEAVPGLWVPALLYEPTRLAGQVPVIINVNGHDRQGKSAPYKQRRCINLAQRGMLAVSLEFLGMGQLRDEEDRGNRHNLLTQLDLCGTSGLAPFYLVLQRGLDVALAHEHADPHRVGVTGLSGGGWQTIWLAALDPRVTLANPVAGYCSVLARSARRNNLGDAEQIPSDLCTVADYTHLTAMVAPRPLLLTYNAQDDCCFLPPDVLPALQSAARPIYGLYEQSSSFRTHINLNPGTHNFERDNREALYRIIGTHFFPADEQFSATDINLPAAEIRTADELAVPLPPRNATLHSLALQLSRQLPRRSCWPGDLDAAQKWQAELRARLQCVVKLPEYQTAIAHVEQADVQGLRVATRRMRMDEHWTVPAVDFQLPDAESTLLLVSDEGRHAVAGMVQTAVLSGQRVLAIDLLGFGEAGLHLEDGKDDDTALLLAATVGHRALGIQAAQLISVARRMRAEDADLPLTIVAVGQRSSVIALVAAALETRAIDGVELHHCWGSLHELIRQNMLAEEAPELFCFGLLKELDISDLIALVAPRPVTVHDADQQARWHLTRLSGWYRMFGKEFVLAP